MMTLVMPWLDSVELLKPILEEWEKENNASEFGIELTWERVMRDLEWLQKNPNSEILTLCDDGPVGFLAILSTDNFLGPGRFALEKYWYIAPKHRKYGTSMRLINAAKNWAQEHGCEHLIMSTSNLASDMHDKVARFYETIGMKLFETAYIVRI